MSDNVISFRSHLQSAFPINLTVTGRGKIRKTEKYKNFNISRTKGAPQIT